ncbi:thermonuclease family protein [Chryseobacterium sp. RG1]|uniref:Thermonuclease family protein n=1 Tax=Chryseobacterium tagetis TaxID=2801334 RepID=A0ABS8A5X1_9FLAO|nr:thermonuclease family protein [Chryseobacterium tagetis]MCA6069381.1 thermonuclease family protein [Chryseobacterium tagetis]
MKLKFVCVILFLSYHLLCSQSKGKVIKVKDGDTVVVLLGNNRQETLRLAEVDCPESGQAFGKNAKQFTSSQVFGKKVVFYRIAKDRYKRTVAKIFYDDDKYLSAEIIKSGWGWWYFKASKSVELKDYELKAKNSKTGLWKDNNAISPWEFRKNKRKKKEVL